MYVFALAAVKVADCPTHKTLFVLTTLIVGNGLTVILLIADNVFIQPKASVPVTVNELVLVGETTALPPENVYVRAPEGIIVNDCPVQITPLLTVTDGAEKTVIVLTAATALTQPAALVNGITNSRNRSNNRASALISIAVCPRRQHCERLPRTNRTAVNGNSR